MLIAQGLSCLRGDRLLFKNINLELNSGGLLYILGENGSGKSSLLRMLCGLLMPESGQITWLGKPIKKEPDVYHANMLYIGHLNGLKDDLTAKENLKVAEGIRNIKVDDKSALAALASIGIERCANLPVRVLSQGQKRRVALARLWLTESQLWILDEPFAALDVASIEVLTARLNQHMSNGGMTIVTTHQDVMVNARVTESLRLSS